MTLDLFSWSRRVEQHRAAAADSFGVRRVCACNCFWLFRQPDALLSRYTIIQRKSRWPE